MKGELILIALLLFSLTFVYAEAEVIPITADDNQTQQQQVSAQDFNSAITSSAIGDIGKTGWITIGVLLIIVLVLLIYYFSRKKEEQKI